MLSSEKNLMHEVMIDCFLQLEEENLEGKDNREVLLAWVNWIDSRYKVAIVPGVCYAIIDCDDGEVVSMINADIPNAKQQANKMCATLNGQDLTPTTNTEERDEDMLNAQEVADAFLSMDESSFMDF